MIISHKNRFIFIKTEKTAGTSIEIALSKYCGPDDIITPISPKDEKMRKELGYRGPQNYNIPFKKYTKFNIVNALYKRKRMSFYNHTAASFIIKYIDQEVWDSYFKFCFERNPWDKAVSLYHWRYKTEPFPPITDFIQSKEVASVRGFNLYTCSSDIVVDKVYKYEELNQAMEDIHDRIGLDEIPSLPRAKANHRKDKRNYRDMLSEKDRDRIAKVFAREIAYFNYKW